MWNVTATDGSDNYTYYLNICNEDEDDGLPCPDDENHKNVSVCQKKDSDTTFAKVIGRMNQQTLR